MKDRLSGALPVVDNSPITAFRVTLIVRDSRRHSQEVSEHSLIFLRSVIQRLNMVSRNYQDVRGRLGIDIANRHAALVLKHNGGGSITRDNATKETIVFRHDLILL